LHDSGCVGLLLETISPFLDSSSPILNHALRIVEVLGAYRSVQSYPVILVTYMFVLVVPFRRYLFCQVADMGPN
jgi:WD repeat and FYVE domain-containing protein 3